MTVADLTDRRKRGPNPSLTRDQVVAAGLQLMANQGLDSVSLRAVAQHLGVDHKTLYGYVSDKDDLLAGMFDCTLSELDLPREDDARPAEDQLVDLFVSIRRVLMANIDLFRLRRPSHIVGTGWSGAGRILSAIHTLVPDHEPAAELFANLTQLAVGSAMESVQAPQGAHDLAAQARQVDPALYPTYHSFADAWGGLDRDQAYERLLRDVIHISVSRSSR